MKKIICIALCLCIILLCACTSQESDEKLAENILSLCNEQREKEKLPALTIDDGLCDSALIRADEITTDGNFSHVRPDGSGCFTVIRGEYSYAGENLAKGDTDADKIVSAWMASPDHRANIMNPDFSRAGIAFVKSGDSYYFVMLFSG